MGEGLVTEAQEGCSDSPRSQSLRWQKQTPRDSQWLLRSPGICPAPSCWAQGASDACSQPSQLPSSWFRGLPALWSLASFWLSAPQKPFVTPSLLQTPPDCSLLCPTPSPPSSGFCSKGHSPILTCERAAQQARPPVLGASRGRSCMVSAPGVQGHPAPSTKWTVRDSSWGGSSHLLPPHVWATSFTKGSWVERLEMRTWGWRAWV